MISPLNNNMMIVKVKSVSGQLIGFVMTKECHKKALNNKGFAV